MLERDPSLTLNQVKNRLKGTAEDRGFDATVQGAGYLDAYRPVYSNLGDNTNLVTITRPDGTSNTVDMTSIPWIESVPWIEARLRAASILQIEGKPTPGSYLRDGSILWTEAMKALKVIVGEEY